jgi:hypothetical protein
VQTQPSACGIHLMTIDSAQATLRKRLKNIVGVLHQEPEEGREALRDILGGDKIKLVPNKSRTHLWADYGLGIAA